MSNNKGFFLVLEGVDGTGKTTQAQMLADYFQTQGREVYMTKQPTFLVDMTGWSDDKKVRHFTMLREAEMTNNILPALDAGKIVISDRWLLSTVAYQQNAEELAFKLHAEAITREPDLTILLDYPMPVVSLRGKSMGFPVCQWYNVVGAYARNVPLNNMILAELPMSVISVKIINRANAVMAEGIRAGTPACECEGASPAVIKFSVSDKVYLTAEELGMPKHVKSPFQEVKEQVQSLTAQVADLKGLLRTQKERIDSMAVVLGFEDDWK